MAVLTECETHLLAMHGQLMENPHVQIFSAKPGQIIEEYGDAREVFEKISIWHGISLDRSLQRCFVRFNWFSSHWRIERPGIRLTGEFTIRHLLTSMNVNAPDIDWGKPRLSGNSIPSSASSITAPGAGREHLQRYA